MRKYLVKIQGDTPLLLHADNISWADEMEAWKNNPKNKKISRAGDDRSPAFRWIGCLNHDGEHVSLSVDVIMATIMAGGTMVLVPGGRSGKTFKAQTQSGIMPFEMNWPLYVNGNLIKWADIVAIKDEPDFLKHESYVKSLGFSLFVKRARIGQSKHIRVRPRFDSWSTCGEIVVSDEQITQTVLQDILQFAGRYKGIGDWRPGGKTPGVFGMFNAEVVAVR